MTIERCATAIVICRRIVVRAIMRRIARALVRQTCARASRAIEGDAEGARCEVFAIARRGGAGEDGRRARAYSRARSKTLAPTCAEEMKTIRIAKVTGREKELVPEDGVLYGSPPESWEARERATMSEERSREMDEFIATFVEPKVKASALPSLEAILASADEEAAAEKLAREKERAEAELASIRVPIRDSAGRSYGTGKRKSAIARVWLAPGTGEHKINGKPYDEYFPSPKSRANMVAPFFVSDTLGLFSAVATVRGGGMSGQVQAVRHGISVALQNYDPVFRASLKAAGFLTRDPRVVERKKPGKAKARKSFAWVKR